MVVSIEKYADPAKKERLLASKKSWNENVKLLIAKLIAFKRGINGKGDEDAGLPPVDIKDPFPVEFNTYLSSIVEDYTKVVDGASFVINLQEDFSNNRRKSSREIREMSVDDQLISEASWWGSRAWAWVDLYSLGKETRYVRLKMLSWSKKAVPALKNIEYYFNSGYDVKGIIGLIKFINLFIGGFLQRLEQLKNIDMKNLEEIDIPQPKAGDQGLPPDKVPNQNEIGDTIVGGPPPALGPSIDNIKAQFIGGILKSRVDRITGGQHKVIIESQFNRLNDAFNNDSYSEDEIKDIYTNLIGLLESAENSGKVGFTEKEEINKIAQNILSRWLARQKFNLKNKTKTDDIKAQITDDLRDVIRQFDELMDIIENKDLGTPDIEEKVKDIGTILYSISESVLWLADDYRLDWKLEKDPKKRPAKLEEKITNMLKKLMKLLPRN